MPWKGKKTLVTGAAGFIGCHLLRELVHRGAESVGLDVGGPPEGLPASSWVQADIRDGAVAEALVRFGAFDVVFHLAASADVKKSAADSRCDLEQNVLGTVRLLEDLTKCEPVPLLVFASTGAVSNLSFKVGEEDGPLLPISLYGASKLAAEAFVSAYCHLYGIAAVIVRFGNVVGPGMTYNAIVDFLKKLRASGYKRLELMNDGGTVRSYLHVEDAVEGLLMVPQPMWGTAAIMNLAGRDDITTLDMAQAVLEQIAPQAELVLGERRQSWSGDAAMTCLDIGLAEELGWVPEMDSRSAVKRAAIELSSVYCPELAVGGLSLGR